MRAALSTIPPPPPPPSSSSLSISIIHHHPPCRSRWTCGWWGPPRGCGRSRRCRRRGWGWGGRWTAEGDSPGWRRPAGTQRGGEGRAARPPLPVCLDGKNSRKSQPSSSSEGRRVRLGQLHCWFFIHGIGFTRTRWRLSRKGKNDKVYEYGQRAFINRTALRPFEMFYDLHSSLPCVSCWLHYTNSIKYLFIYLFKTANNICKMQPK